jgi:cytochrome b6-f complex iron-sulfur subunit
MKTLPTLSHDGTDGGGRPAAPVSRRAFVSAATLSVIGAALASACSGGGDGPTGVITPPTTTGVTVSGSVITIDLAQVPALEAADGFILVSRPSTLVIRTGTDAYRAFTSVCTHEQCTVGDYRGGRIVCPCHGSQYDSSGQVVVGPATRPLREFAVALDAEARVLTVTAT